MKLVKRTLNYVKKNGIESFVPRVKRYFKDKRSLSVYYKKHTLSEQDKEKQRKQSFAYAPKISIIIPMYCTPIQFFEELVDSIRQQTYSNWELCLADGSEKKSEVSKRCAELMHMDERIKYQLLEKNEGIAGNTNAALAMATGEFVMLVDHDDLLEESALYECVLALNKDKTIDSIYTDEDKINLEGTKHFEPHFKPDLNIERLRCCNYICHLFVTRREIANMVGGFSAEHEGSQDYDFIFKCIEKSRTVHHIPKILYHWRCHPNSVAGNPDDKKYAYVSGQKAIHDHYSRCGINTEVQLIKDRYGYYRTRRKIQLPQALTLAVYNPSGNKKKIEKGISQIAHIHTCYVKDTAQLNKLLGDMDTEYCLLLHEDMQIVDNDYLYHLFEYGVFDEVTAVTGRMYSSKGKIIQGPMVFGLNRFIEYSFFHCPKGELGYFHNMIMPQNVSMVDFRFALLKKSVWECNEGLDTELELPLAIPDYCLRAAQRGLHAVYNPAVELCFQGQFDMPVCKQDEMQRFETKWRKIYKEGDPYYNKNFSLSEADYTVS